MMWTLIKKIMRVALMLIAALLLGSVVLTIYLQASGSRRLDAFCTRIEPGTPVTDLAHLAQSQELHLTLPGIEAGVQRWRAFARSMARGETCDITHDGKQVLERGRNSLH